MPEPTTEALFAAFRDTGDPQALAAVFDRLAPQLLLVAAHLAGGDLAQDLVQATFLDAMRQRRRWDGRRLAPWLVGMLGNHVREARRQRRRVPDARRLPAKESTTPLHDVEANECFAAVAAAVERLPRHYRQVLSLRLVHGFELQQIAHALDVPMGTVKVRLHRGLAQLRRALPAGLTSMLAVLAMPSLGLATARQHVLAEAALAAASGVGVGVGIVFGGWAMKKLVAGIAAVALVAAGWFVLDPLGQAAVAVDLPEPAAPLAHAGTTAPEASPRAAEMGAPAPAGTTAGSPAVVRSEAPSTGALVVQVVWAADGEPAPLVQVGVWQRGDRKSLTGVSDAAGQATFAALSPGNYRLVANRAQQSPKETSAEVRAGDTTTFRLEIGGDVQLHVTVVDRDGAPRRGAAVWCTDPYARDEVQRCLGTTDVDGKLAYRGFPLHEVWARAAGCQPSPAHELPGFDDEQVHREPVHVRLTLGDEGCTLIGSVVGPQGHPAAGARVAIACDDTLMAQQPELLLIADAQGRFHVDELPAGERFVVASLPEFAPAIARVATSTTGPTTVVLQLRTGVTLTGRVTDANSQPLADATVTSSIPRVAVVGIRSPWGNHRLTRTDADGRYRLIAIAPGAIIARVQGTPEVSRELTAADGEVVVWDVTREPERVITGRVVDSEDKPLVGWELTAHAADARRAVRFLPAPHATDGEGRFRITGLLDDSYRLFVVAPVANGQERFSAAAQVPRAIIDDVRPSPEPRTIRIDAAGMASGWLEGSLALPDGLQAAAELSLLPKGIAGRGGFGVPQQHLVAGQTTFRIGPLPAGEYDLHCDIEGRGRLTQRGLRLAANATLRLPPFAFDAQRPQVILLRHADGRPAAGAVVKLRSDMMPCRETSPGRYESAATETGADEALVRGPDFLAASMPVTRSATSTPIELEVRGATPVVVVLKPPVPRERWIGFLNVKITDVRGTEIVRDMMQIDGGGEFRWPIGLAPGTYSLQLSALGDGSVTTTVTVGSSPLQVELQLVK